MQSWFPSLQNAGFCLVLWPQEAEGAAEWARADTLALLLSFSSQKQLWQYQFLPDVRLACVRELAAL